MLVIPSIDLEGGKAVKRVRGRRGEYVFVGDPLELARRFSRAPLIHVVDLDGAERGTPANLDVVAAISNVVEGTCQLGGGLRDLASVAKALDLCDYAVLGTLPFTAPRIFEEIARSFPGRLVVSLDVLEGWVMGGGWTAKLLRLEDAVRQLEGFDLAAAIYTSIDVEGTGAGPLIADVEALRRVARRIYYAGGVSNCAHLASLKRAGFDGVIVGYALYRGDLSCIGEGFTY
ncbi:MAG: 1-(5-phosphoribosyl)-5-[(5-phosphoribosylamino)methylideneamino] imidazole-4-carboxamide isomerase [Thermoproteus sp.]|jgi:phosphoribosylformimino-5-aminoimidazole carboxamide ribotide isomerase|nr:1-(5-phosphoribosyl)-5-[(5-phosphoribosylamino)methylideneamino] imidazole-4-carboxamide isomerase [Thermoproteus sp.]